MDSETGLDYAKNRYHVPGTGRFLTPHPYIASVGPTNPGSWNRYAYVLGDPIKHREVHVGHAGRSTLRDHYWRAALRSGADACLSSSSIICRNCSYFMVPLMKCPFRKKLGVPFSPSLWASSIVC